MEKGCIHWSCHSEAEWHSESGRAVEQVVVVIWVDGSRIWSRVALPPTGARSQ